MRQDERHAGNDVQTE